MYARVTLTPAFALLVKRVRAFARALECTWAHSPRAFCTFSGDSLLGPSGVTLLVSGKHLLGDAYPVSHGLVYVYVHTVGTPIPVAFDQAFFDAPRCGCRGPSFPAAVRTVVVRVSNIDSLQPRADDVVGRLSAKPLPVD